MYFINNKHFEVLLPQKMHLQKESNKKFDQILLIFLNMKKWGRKSFLKDRYMMHSVF